MTKKITAAQLRKMPVDEAIELINADLSVIYGGGYNTKAFGKNDIEGLKIGCSWTTITNHFNQLGYRLDTDAQQYVLQGDNKVQQNITTLTDDEILFIKDLFAKSKDNEPQFVVDGKPMLIVPVMTGKKKTTGVSVYEEQWTRWTKFKERYSMYSGTDLLAMALDEFMQKYENDDVKNDNKE